MVNIAVTDYRTLIHKQIQLAKSSMHLIFQDNDVAVQTPGVHQ
jgi:hypothetical protein